MRIIALEAAGYRRANLRADLQRRASMNVRRSAGAAEFGCPPLGSGAGHRRDDVVVTDWIVAVCTAAAVLGGAFSWWKANMSRTAQDAARTAAVEAVDAADRAAATLAEIRRQTLALETLTASVTPDPQRLEHDSGTIWHLWNTTTSEIAVERIENLAEFPTKPIDLLPVVIPPGGAVEVTLFSAWGAPVPATMELRLRGRDDVFRVPIPRWRG